MTDQPATASGTFSLGESLSVHRLGFGAMRITGKGIWGPPDDRDEAIRVLRRCLDLGINFIDTADSYGPYVSEELIAEALYPYADGLVIATKGGLERSGPNKWESNGRPEHLRQACEGSLKRLRVEQIDLYQLHRIDPDVPADDQLGTLQDLHREGKINLIGLSEVGIDEIEQARQYFPVVSVQNRYNIGDREHDEVLDFCTEEGIGFIPWYPLAAGKGLTEQKLTEAAEELGATPAQVALAWLLRRSPVMLPIPGTSKVKHLEQNAQAATLELPDELYASLTEVEQES